MIASMAMRSDGSGIPSKKSIQELQQQIDDLQAQYSLATATEEEHRDKMIEHLKLEFNA